MLKKLILISGIWSYLNIFFQGIFALSIGLIFSRFLDVKEYGFFVTGEIVINFLSNFGELGLSTFILNKETIDEGFSRTTISISLITSLFLVIFLNLFILIIPFESQYKEIIFIISCLSLKIPAKNLLYIINSIWFRDLKNKLITKISILSESTSLVLSFLILYKFDTLTALIVFAISKPWLKLLISLKLKNFKYRFYIDKSSIKQILNFGIPVIFSRLITYLNLQAPKIACGIFLGPYYLGLLSASILIIQNIHNIIEAPLGTFWMPIISKIKREYPNRFGEFYLRVRDIQAAIIIPIFILLASMRYPIINNFLPNQFSEIVNIIVPLCFSGILLSANYLFQPVLIILGETKQILFYDLLKCFLLLTFLIPLSKGGLNSILFSILIVDIILFIGSQYYLKTKIKKSVISQLKNLKMIFLSSIPILITPLILGGFYLKINLIGLTLVIFANFISYILLIYSLDRKLFLEFMNFKTLTN